MPKFQFEVVRRIVVARTLSVMAATEEEAEKKLDQMIADNDKKVALEQITLVVGTDWEVTEDDVELEPL
jgi:hypothetical protein